MPGNMTRLTLQMCSVRDMFDWASNSMEGMSSKMTEWGPSYLILWELYFTRTPLSCSGLKRFLHLHLVHGMVVSRHVHLGFPPGRGLVYWCMRAIVVLGK